MTKNLKLKSARDHQRVNENEQEIFFHQATFTSEHRPGQIPLTALYHGGLVLYVSHLEVILCSRSYLPFEWPLVSSFLALLLSVLRVNFYIKRKYRYGHKFLWSWSSQNQSPVKLTDPTNQKLSNQKNVHKVNNMFRMWQLCEQKSLWFGN